MKSDDLPLLTSSSVSNATSYRFFCVRSGKQMSQWTPLWQDITGRAEAVLDRDLSGSRSDRIGNHFLGAVVLNQIRVFGRQIDTVQVIDGQQRLTTLQLMIAAFRDLLRRK